MRLRVTTAMALVLSMGVLAACGEEEAEVEVEESAVEVPAEEPVVVEEEVADVDAVVVDEEAPAEDAEVIAEAGDAEPIELETDVESDGEPIVASTETDAADEADAAGTGTDTAEIGTDAAEPLAAEGEIEAAEAEAETEETLGEVVGDGEELDTAATESSPEGEDAAGEDDLITLDTNVTVVDEVDATTDGETAEVAGAESALGEGTDAEATVDPAAPADAQVEATNDVATDGVDSASEANMLDLDNLVLDDAGVQQLTEYVEASDQIDETQKVTLVAGIDAARDNPERLEEIVNQIRELTGQ